MNSKYLPVALFVIAGLAVLLVPLPAAVKDLLARVESLLDGAKGEAPQNRQGGDARGSSDLFGFNTVKSDLQAKQADAAPGPQKQAPFMEIPKGPE